MHSKKFRTNLKKTAAFLIAVCMMLTGAQIPGSISVVHAGETSSVSDNNGLQSSFTTGGLVDVLCQDYEDDVIGNAPTAVWTWANNTGEKAATAVIGAGDDGNSGKVLRFTYNEGLNGNPQAHTTINAAYRSAKGVLKYDFKIDSVTSDTGDYILLPNLKSSNDAWMSYIRAVQSSGKYYLWVQSNANAVEVELDKWYTLEVLCDIATNKCTVYITDDSGKSVGVFQELNFIASVAADKSIAYIVSVIHKNTTAAYDIDNLHYYKYEDYTGFTANATVETISVGDTAKVVAKYTTASASFPCTGATFASNNESVATVDANGIVTGVSQGEAVITVTPPAGSAYSSVTKTITVTEDDSSIETEILYSENFETANVSGDAETKAYLKNNGYTIFYADPNYKFDIVTEGENSFLKIEQEQIQANYLYLQKELGKALDKAVIKYKVKSEDNDGYFFLPHFTDVVKEYDGAGNLTKLKYLDYVSPLMRLARLDICTYTNPDTYVSPDNNSMQKGEWYEVELVADVTAGTYDLYLNGDCIMRQSTDIFRKDPAQELDSIRFGNVGFAGINTYYLDDLQVTGYVNGKSVAFADDTPAEMYVGHTEKLQLVFDPIDTSVHSAVFTSSDPSVATVDAYGNVTGVSAGTVTITADPSLEALDSVQTTITVKEKVAVESVTVDKAAVSLPVGGHTYLNTTVAPANASFPEITYSSSNASVATVDEWGEILAIGAGNATITITSNDDPTKKATVEVTVTKPTTVETIYVAPNGSDSGTGTDSDKVSIKRAMELVAANNDNMTGNIEVILDGGYYQQSETIEFTEAHSGTNGYTVIWKAAEGAEPVIGGGIFLDGTAFTDTDEDGIYVADVPEGTDTRQMFVDNVRATRARSKGPLTNASYQADYGYLCDNVEIAEWKNPDDLELVFYRVWKNMRCSVDRVETTADGKLKVIMDQPGWYELVRFQGGLINLGWYENAIELLDEPGEWYLDRTANKLYYMPRLWENMGEVTVTLPVVEDLITIKGSDYTQMVENIYFEGITFADTTWLRPSTDAGHIDHQNNHIYQSVGHTANKLPGAAVTVAKANSICFTDCTFTRLGISALKMVDGVQNSMVVGNHFYDISGGAVNIGEPDYVDTDVINPSDRNMLMKNNDVLNNYIHDVAVEYESAAAISVGFAANTDLSYNEIFNIPYSGFHIGYGWDATLVDNITRNMVISNNFLHHVSAGTVHDGGAIYVIGNAGLLTDKRINKITGNYVKDQLQPYAAIYTDSGSRNWSITGNVIDLSKVTETVAGTLPNWLLTGETMDVLAEGNYATNAAMIQTSTGWYYPETDYVGNFVMELKNNNIYPEANWPQAALDIIEATGLQGEYTALRSDNKQAEVITSNVKKNGISMGVGDTYQLSIAIADGKDNTISNEAVRVYYETVDKKIATVSESGMITGEALGETKVRIYVLSNDVLDVIEGDVYVGDVLSEVKISGVNDTVTLPMAEKQLDVYGVTALDRRCELDSITYTIADTSIATVDANGLLKPVKVGTTKLTITATSGGRDKTVEYSVKVVEEGTLVSYNLSEIFDSVNRDQWNVVQGEPWVLEEGKKITTTLARYANYKGSKFENELLDFTLNIDSSVKTGGWPAISIRNQDYGNFVGAAGSTGYIIIFSADGLEVFRFNQGNRDGQFISYDTNSGYNCIYEYNSELYDKFTHCVDHDVQVGAINEEAGVRLVLYIDGTEIFNFVDTSQNAIREAGYFGLVGRGETFTLTKKAESDTKVDVQVNNNTGSDTTGGATVTAPQGGWIEGENTFTVSGSNAYVVMVSEDNGETYTRLNATVSGEDTYSFTVDVTAETIITVATAGDVNGDGQLTNADITKLRSAYAGKIELEGVQAVIADVNGDDSVTNADITKIRAAFAGKTDLS